MLFTDGTARPGDLVRVRIDKTYAFDLVGPITAVVDAAPAAAEIRPSLPVARGQATAFTSDWRGGSGRLRREVEGLEGPRDYGDLAEPRAELRPPPRRGGDDRQLRRRPPRAPGDDRGRRRARPRARRPGRGAHLRAAPGEGAAARSPACKLLLDRGAEGAAPGPPRRRHPRRARLRPPLRRHHRRGVRPRVPPSPPRPPRGAARQQLPLRRGAHGRRQLPLRDRPRARLHGQRDDAAARRRRPDLLDPGAARGGDGTRRGGVAPARQAATSSTATSTAASGWAASSASRRSTSRSPTS